MRTKIVAGNWKMNQNKQEALAFVKELNTQETPSNVRLLIAPSFVVLDACQEAANDKVEIVAQNMNAFDSGAYTGEVSADMLNSLGVKSVIIGHSERRSIYGETHEDLKAKVKQAIANNLEVIFCVGESLDERNAGQAEATVKAQLVDSLFFLSEAEMAKVVIAYEPVWAIGTGQTATPEQAQEIHAFIRELLTETYSENLANATPILYGGSVNPGNAKELFGQADVDGGLVGGASLKVDSFVALAHSF